jgi:hypothetical protein
MTDLAITAASLAPASNAVIRLGTPARPSPRARSSTSTAPCSSGSWPTPTTPRPPSAIPTGIALTTATAAGQPLVGPDRRRHHHRRHADRGGRYYLSATAGGICPEADLTTGMEPLIGIARSTTLLGLLFANSGVTL